MISYFSINRDELGELIAKARLVAIVLLAELVDKSFVVYANALEPGLSRIEQNIRVKNSCYIVEQVVKLCLRLEENSWMFRDPQGLSPLSSNLYLLTLGLSNCL